MLIAVSLYWIDTSSIPCFLMKASTALGGMKRSNRISHARLSLCLKVYVIRSAMVNSTVEFEYAHHRVSYVVIDRQGVVFGGNYGNPDGGVERVNIRVQSFPQFIHFLRVGIGQEKGQEKE